MLSRFTQISRCFFAAESIIKSVPGHKAPALADNPAGRYAGSLFTVASQNESLHLVLDDLKYIQEVINTSSPFRDFLKNSALKKQQQREVLDAAITSGLNTVSVNFVNTLVDSGRCYISIIIIILLLLIELSDLPKIIETYQDYYKILNKQEDIKVISAKELTEEEKKRVVESLQKGRQGVTFKVSYEVDSSILGGLQIYSGSTFLDCSLRSRLERLRGELAKLG